MPGARAGIGFDGGCRTARMLVGTSPGIEILLSLTTSSKAHVDDVFMKRN
jgi:hypothetical protein